MAGAWASLLHKSRSPRKAGANGVLCSCSPEIEAPYVREEEKERLLGLYQYLHSRAHNSSRPLKNIYFTGPRENLLAWVRAVFRVGMTPTSLVLSGTVQLQHCGDQDGPQPGMFLLGVPVPESDRTAM